MGNCVGVGAAAAPAELWKRAAAYRVGAKQQEQEPLPDTSLMATEDLLRRGIAEAQCASAAKRRRDRACHVLLARRFLLAALQRYSRGPSRSPEISAHLLAVLLKLGEDAQAVQGVLADSSAGLFGGYVPSADPGVAVAGERLEVGSDTGRTPSEHSSREEDDTALRSWSYDQLKENFLSPDSSDEDEDESDQQSPGESVLGPMPTPETLPPISPMMSREASSKTAALPAHPPSPASFLPEGSAGSWPKPLLVGTEERFQRTPSTAGCEKGPPASARMSPARSPRAPCARPDLRSAVQDAAAAAALSTSAPWATPATSPQGLSPSIPVAKLRSLQPQQVAQTSSLPSQRRPARTAREEAKEAKEAPLEPAVSRPRRRQPSQGSSSGSQGASDSETGAAARLRAAKGRGEALKEEPPWTSVIDEEGPSQPPDDIYLGPVGYNPSSPLGPKPSSRMMSRHDSRSDVELAGTLGGLDTLSMAGSYAPSGVPSPHIMAAIQHHDSWTPRMAAAVGGSLALSPCQSDADLQSRRGLDSLSVRILNGVSGEEEVRFEAPLQAVSEQQFLRTLDLLCLRHAGQALAGLNWLNRESQALDRFLRRKCDVRMVEELWDSWMQAKDTEKGAVLLLCTVPVQPPSELQRSKVRLKDLAPDKVVGGTEPVWVQLDTSLLEAGRVYHVAFTSQWTNQTHSEEARVLPNNKGVEVMVPMMVASNEGLYDVHLVIDSTWRSENRRTLTVGSSDSELDSSSTAKSQSTSSFVPIARSEGHFESHEHYERADSG